MLLAAMMIGVGWLYHLGAAGLLVVGVIDQSFIPIPGGIDMLLIVLVASHKDPLMVYWVMAMAGAIGGGWLTYRLSKKGGKEALEKRLPRKRIKKIEKAFDKGGGTALFVAGLVPPPLPMVPVVVGAGALQYSQRKFLIALTASRAIRYTIVVYLAHHYGQGIMSAFTAHKWAIIIGFAIFSVGAAVTGWLFTRYEKRKEAREGRSSEPATPKKAA